MLPRPHRSFVVDDRRMFGASFAKDGEKVAAAPVPDALKKRKVISTTRVACW